MANDPFGAAVPFEIEEAEGETPDPLLLDTDVFSHLVKGSPEAAKWAPLVQGKYLLLSFASVAELYAWTEIRQMGVKRRAALQSAIDTTVVLAPTEALTVEWARVRAEATKTGHALSGKAQAHDAWIAATARLHSVPLATGNSKHFAGFSGVQLLGP